LISRRFDSSNVRSCCLDEGTGLLEVSFHNGARWRYRGVTMRELDAWCRAPSAGSFFARVIKGNPHRYPPERVPRDSDTLEVELARRIVVAIPGLPDESALQHARQLDEAHYRLTFPHDQQHVDGAARPHVDRAGEIIPIGMAAGQVLESRSQTSRSGSDPVDAAEERGREAHAGGDRVAGDADPAVRGAGLGLEGDGRDARVGELGSSVHDVAGARHDQVVGHTHKIRPLELECNNQTKLTTPPVPDAVVCVEWPVVLEVGCQHELLRAMNDGACPVCPPRVPSEEKGGAPCVAVHKGQAPGGTPTQSEPDRKGRVVGASPAPPTTIRPPTVEQPTPSSAPVGEAHGSDEPEYMRRSLTTLTREEATRLLIRIDAMRMRHSIRKFIRGRLEGGRWRGGAWDVLEGEVILDWNWHHDSLCMHTQAMLEEWILAGLATPEEVDRTLRDWERVRRCDPDPRRNELAMELELVLGYRAHWEATCAAAGQRTTYKQRTQDLAVNVGPISLKSRIVMVMAVAWMWTRVPSWEVFCASGTPSNVSRDSLACRDLVQSAWYRDQFDIQWKIKDDLDRVDKWGTTAGGVRESRGAGGSVTGIHADGILLDDPDDAAKVWGDAARRDAMTFWLALGNRIKDPRRPLRIVVQQNLHDEDLTSRLVRLGMPRLAIPVEFSPAERGRLYSAPFGWRDPRELEGDLLHKTRFTPEFLAAERIRLGTHGFEAQYNCNPRPLDGGMIKRGWFQFFRIEDDDANNGLADRPRPTGCLGAPGTPPVPALVLKTRRKSEVHNDVSWITGEIGHIDLDWLTITVDATFGSLSNDASAVGLLVVGGKGMRRFVFDDRSEPMTFHATVAAIKALIGKWPAKRVIIELKANGASVIEELTKQIKDSSVMGVDGRPAMVVVEAVNPEGGKESRAAAMVPAIESGCVYLLDGAPWLENFVGEVCVFPNAKRDDRVDALSQLMTKYRDSDIRSAWGKMGKK